MAASASLPPTPRPGGTTRKLFWEAFLPRFRNWRSPLGFALRIPADIHLEGRGLPDSAGITEWSMTDRVKVQQLIFWIPS